MNKLPGHITFIQSSENISIVDVTAAEYIFSSIVLGTTHNTDYLREGTDVFILFKETEVSLGKNLSGLISLRNRMKSVVMHIEKGIILTKVTMDFQGTPITSIITTRSADRLLLAIGDDVEALVKANEITLMPVG